MALDQETIDQQIALLAAHRRTLFHLLGEAAQFSAGHLPAHVANGIAEARANISRVKVYLRENSTPVRDGPNVEAPPATSPASAEAHRKSAEQRVLDDILETYIKQMEELLIDKSLVNSQPDTAVRNIARTRTLTALRQLDGEHNQKLIQFLQDARLIRGQFPPIDLSKSDLSRVNLSKANLSNVNLSSANLRDANLRDADLRDAVLQYVDLRDADLRDANLRIADLRWAKLHGAKLHGAILTGVHLEVADLQGAYLPGNNLVGVYLQDAKLWGAKLQGANLHGADLQGADLEGANLSKANLYEADLREANLEGANLADAIVTDVQLWTARSLRGATMPDGSIHE